MRTFLFSLLIFTGCQTIQRDPRIEEDAIKICEDLFNDFENRK
jgi:hypothetical protein